MGGRDYRTHLLTVAARKPSTVNAHMTAIADFYRRRGLGPASARREDLPMAAPRALDHKAQLRWLRAAENAPKRDKALAHVGFYAGLRIGEIVALNIADVQMSARKGHLVFRYGKGGRYREVPLHPALRSTLEAWLGERSKWPGAADQPAVFLNRRGGRLSTRGAYDVLTSFAQEAGIAVGRGGEFTPHVLRHTAGTTLTRAGTDIVIVAELLGHSVETARRYCRAAGEVTAGLRSSVSAPMRRLGVSTLRGRSGLSAWAVRRMKPTTPTGARPHLPTDSPLVAVLRACSESFSS